jgi:peptide/nickel transport system substrate-binding protein
MFSTPMRRSRRLLGIVCVAVLAGLGATGAMAETPVKGGTLVVARAGDIFTLDPYNTQDDPSIFTELTIYDRLVRLSADGKGIDPELAESWKVSDDGMSADFTLRDGVKFSDGSPLTAEDVVFSLSRAVDQKSSWGFLFSPVKSVSKRDARTVHFEMSAPFAPLLPALATFAASIYSKANFEKWGDQAGTHPLGTAAFMLDHWTQGQEVVLVRNPFYWQEGKPYLDKVVFRVVGDDTARLLQLNSGDVDLIANVTANQVEQIEAAGNRVYTLPGSVSGIVTFNQKIKPFDEVAVRRALAYAIDREAIAKAVFFGRARASKSILPSSTFFYDPDTDPISYDLDAAKKALQASSVPSGFEFEANVSSGDSSVGTIAQIWASALAQIGVTMKIVPVEPTTMQDTFNSEKYTVSIGSWTNDTPDPDELLGVSLDYTAQNAHHSNYHSDEARDLVIAGRKELDPKKRQQLYSQMQRLINRDVPYTYTADQDRLFAARPAVQDFMPNSQGKYDFQNVWLKQ